jgi:hypothetical protein
MMRKIALASTLVACSLYSLPAHALQLAFMQRGGAVDASCGPANNPCGSFQAAHNAVADGGEVIVIDSADFGSATITKSITFNADHAYAVVSAGFLVTAGANSVVLRGLIFEGYGNVGTGITAVNAGSLLVDNCVVRNFVGAGGNGLKFAPNGAGKLVVRDSVFTNNGGGGSGGASS